MTREECSIVRDLRKYISVESDGGATPTPSTRTKASETTASSSLDDNLMSSDNASHSDEDADEFDDARLSSNEGFHYIDTGKKAAAAKETHAKKSRKRNHKQKNSNASNIRALSPASFASYSLQGMCEFLLIDYATFERTLYLKTEKVMVLILGLIFRNFKLSNGRNSENG
jgi:hypothetical protein